MARHLSAERGRGGGLAWFLGTLAIAVVLGVLETFVTSCRCGAVQRVLSLRAPPGL